GTSGEKSCQPHSAVFAKDFEQLSHSVAVALWATRMLGAAKRLQFDCANRERRPQSRRKCSPTICTVSIRSFSGSTTTSDRDGMGSLMCLRLYPAIFFFSGCPNADTPICRRNVHALS